MDWSTRFFGLLSLVMVAACGTSGEAEEAEASPAPAAKATADYATVLEAPSPDYAAMQPAERMLPRGATRREATEPMPEVAGEVGRRWIERLQAREALGGYGLAGKGTDGPVSLVDTLLTAKDFDTLVAEQSWGKPPAWISWSFVPELVAPMVSDAAAPAIRYWPASQIRTGMQLEALLTGRVFMRDGCFWVKQGSQPETLAWFHAETGLDRDEEGYLVLIDRVTGEMRARIGEQMSWAGPNQADPADDRVQTYMQACGSEEIVNVGNPQASEMMYVHYPHLREPTAAPPPPSR